MLFRSEDDANATTVRQLWCNARGEFIRKDHSLFGLAMRQGSCAQDEGAFAHRFGEGLKFFRLMQQFGGPDGGARFAPVRFVRRNHTEPPETEIGHGSRDRADVERVSRRDENHIDAIALVWIEQRTIVEPEAER